MSNTGVPLKSGLGVIQGQWKWHHSIDHVRLHMVLFYVISDI